MRLAGLIPILILSICSAQGYPIYSDNGAVNCTIFGEFKDPYTIVEPNGDRNIILNVDVALVRANDTKGAPAQASYSLVDGNDRTYPSRGEFTRFLQPGRELLGFAVPKETIPKALIVDPTADPSGGNRFIVSFGELTNATNGNVTLLYYGILSSKIVSNLKSVDFDIGITNNGTAKLPVTTNNFSLIDQWGWRYSSLEHNAYTDYGFEDMSLNPNETARIKVSFGSLSPLSRPAGLAYFYSNSSSIIMDIDSEGGLLGNLTSLMGSKDQSCCDSGASEPAATNLAGSIKATKARLQKVRESL